jgi:TonB family protein
VRLEAGDRLERDLRLGFGPFRERWMIVTSNLKNGPRPARMPADWGCASSGPPLCGPESLVREFETDEQARLSAPVVAPRRVIDPVQDFQAFRDLDVEGEVTLEGRIGADGVLTSVRVLSTADAALANAALDAVRNMRWEPARLRGVPTDVPLTITIEVLREPRGPARR